jgi:hypothetical protein
MFHDSVFRFDALEGFEGFLEDEKLTHPSQNGKRPKWEGYHTKRT